MTIFVCTGGRVIPEELCWVQCRDYVRNTAVPRALAKRRAELETEGYTVCTIPCMLGMVLVCVLPLADAAPENRMQTSSTLPHGQPLGRPSPRGCMGLHDTNFARFLVELLTCETLSCIKMI